MEEYEEVHEEEKSFEERTMDSLTCTYRYTGISIGIIGRSRNEMCVGWSTQHSLITHYFFQLKNKSMDFNKRGIELTMRNSRLSTN